MKHRVTITVEVQGAETQAQAEATVALAIDRANECNPILMHQLTGWQLHEIDEAVA